MNIKKLIQIINTEIRPHHNGDYEYIDNDVLLALDQIIQKLEQLSSLTGE
jgi:hypothetical protein